MYKDKNIQITKCKLIPKIVGMRLSYVNIKDMNPKDPFVKRSELKRELAKLETRLTAVINTAVAKEPAWFDLAMQKALTPINNRLDNLVEKNNLVE